MKSLIQAEIVLMKLANEALGSAMSRLGSSPEDIGAAKGKLGDEPEVEPARSQSSSGDQMSAYNRRTRRRPVQVRGKAMQEGTK